MRLLDLLSDNTATSSHRIYGVVVGMVTNNQDPDKLGRVKVRFPWLGDSDESAWARLATPMAGNQRGLYFLPEVDDEVLVVFEHGDLRFPYILGGLWGGKDKPPIDNSDGKNNIRLIRSRSGHTIRLNDTDGQETIEIIDKTQKNKITINTAKNTISIIADKDITLSAPKGKITLEAKELELKSSASTKIESNAGMDIKANSMIDIKGATINLN
jgi:uncharacterized protein involved in type VI secretion and phage assembly